METSYSRTVERNIVHEWKIDNISAYVNDFDTDTKITLNSSNFTTGAKINDQWCIRLQAITSLNSFTHQMFTCLYFYLCQLNDLDNINTKFSIFILDNEKTKLFIEERRLLLNKGDTQILSVPKFSLWNNNKDKNLPNNTLTVCLDLTVYDAPVTTCRKLNLKILKHQIAHDYKQLYESKMGSDVVVNVGDTNFEAHRSILMARSPVLAAMFSHDMIEKKENRIPVQDITSEIFEKLLEYIYTDEVTDLDADAERLLEAADKYQIQSLKDICQESLSKTLTVENSLKIMDKADLYDAQELLQFTNDFITSNIKEIIETQDFKNLEKSNLAMAYQLLKKFSFYN
ncbi:speckle-type POZ protein-like isoform X1 [Microplitis mediator]|uniref:speckle-type POZ protein-like isoform X1 n=1 Tax=Microplitis mediator TaxID=375433 RepID=UPI002554CD8B|nr:speckle-type POZ protein-like isoform X1 [Microplitis mediator]